MEKFGLGPSDLMRTNKRLIYSRLTGYGQTGPLAQKAGHDINYVAMSGMISRKCAAADGQLFPPMNFLADMAGGGMTCALGILLALHHRNQTGRGQVIDANMVEGGAYASSFISHASMDTGILNSEDNDGILDGSAHFYRTYKTKDNRYMAVGSLEPKFYAKLLQGLNLSEDDAPQLPPSKQIADKIQKIFVTKNFDEWTKIYDELDACVTPVLTLREAAAHPHNKSKFTYDVVKTEDGVTKYIPNPAPRLLDCSNLPTTKADQVSNNRKNFNDSPDVAGDTCIDKRSIDNNFVTSGAHSVEILTELGYSKFDCERLLDCGVVRQANVSML